MEKSQLNHLAFSWLISIWALTPGCEADDAGGSPDYAGMECQEASECYPAADPQDLEGEVICLADVDNGYCTHTCEDDSNCCAAEGECVSDHPQVCAPFQSQNEQYCFLSCESDDIDDLGGDEYCRTYAHPSFVCRSTGGGSDNRKVCVRSGG